ncbi:hypothetical protein A1O3_06132 [Capronia epimyces CBS 606.96]|uniref:Aminoglycoside phosphotransferase domain-containing protein n=1 Tax=Capronia epimyces CBS 606.96 TaxID=1182542 RepID=W9YJ56_9EURO|nr:uncharacterized protein A1O3_06132 [Capronia epimyces CBS 606.96]EXJ82319.1 hypothetical protein A1O3_06132 [Capronia epimyces CBS 606.96]
MAKAVEISQIAEDLLQLQQTFSLSQLDSVFLDTPRRKVFRLENVVLKFGLDVKPVEAETLRYLAQATKIPLPRLYRDHVHADGTAVIAMEYVEGRILSDVWPSLCPDVKTNLCGQLRDILEDLRRHRSHVIGGIHGNPAVDTRKLVLTGGPFPTERQFNEFLRSDMISAAPKIYRSMLEDAMDEKHDIFLAHGDIRPQNIVVDHGRRKIVAILDWECSGWYPEYWDFVKFFNALDPSLDWFDYVEKIFPETYPRQYLTDSFLGRYLRH